MKNIVMNKYDCVHDSLSAIVERYSVGEKYKKHSQINLLELMIKKNNYNYNYICMQLCTGYLS